MMNNSPCFMCNNALVDDELTFENDLSYFSVGECADGFRIFVSSGCGRSLRILFEHWNGSRWELVGFYSPAHCPACGRLLSEYKRRGKDA